MVRNDRLAPVALEFAGKAAADMSAPGGAGEGPAVQVRTDFRATALWQPNLVTGTDGKASVKVKFPDSLTQWRMTDRVVSRNNQFGIASANMRTRSVFRWSINSRRWEPFTFTSTRATSARVTLSSPFL